MDIARALTFFTEEERWIEKTTIGTLVILVSSLLSFVLVGILGFFIVTGYGIRLMRNVQQGVRPVLPEWDQWGDDLVRGVKLVAAQFIWALPIIVAVLPTVFGAAIADSSRGAGEFVGSMLILCGSCLSILYGLFLVVLQPGITLAFARREQISDAFQFTSIWQWTRDHLSNVAIVAIVYLVGSMIISTVASIVGVVLCVIGLLVTLPLGQLIITYFQFHLYGQLDPGILGAAGGASSYTADYDTSYTRDYEDYDARYTASTGTVASEAEVKPEAEVTPVQDMDIPPVPPVNEPPVPPTPPTASEDDKNDEDRG